MVLFTSLKQSLVTVQLFSDRTSYRLVNRYGRFGGTWGFGVQRLCSRRRGLDCTGSEDVDINLLLNVQNIWQPTLYLDLYHRRCETAKSLLSTRFFHDRITRVTVTTAWRVLRLRTEPCMWRVAANILNKQLKIAERGWSYSMGVGRRSTRFIWCSRNI